VRHGACEGFASMHKISLFTFLFLFSGCADAGHNVGRLSEADLDDPGAADQDSLDSEDSLGALAAPLRELTASIDGLTIHVSPLLQVESVNNVLQWRVDGRSSIDLGSVSSWVPDDAYAEATLTGPRTFSIVFRDPSERNTMASGLPLFVTVTPVDGVPADAAIWFRPRLASGPGSSRVQFSATIKPIWVAGDVLYRGTVATEPGWKIAITSVPAPTITSPIAGKVRLDWSFDILEQALRQRPSRLLVSAQRDNAVVERSAELQVRTLRLGLTRRDPREVWPRLCKDTVRACLISLPSGVVDTEPCGSYREVLACGGLDGARSAGE
jgi:hypothetical protein